MWCPGDLDGLRQEHDQGKPNYRAQKNPVADRVKGPCGETCSYDESYYRPDGPEPKHDGSASTCSEGVNNDQEEDVVLYAVHEPPDVCRHNQTPGKR